MKHNNISNIILNELKLNYNIDLPDELPLSIIAKEFDENINDNNLNEIFIIAATKLYNKYIDPYGAQLEVNISSDKRIYLVKIFKINLSNETMESMLPALEGAVHEISHLMNDSNSRFRQKTVFLDVLHSEAHQRKSVGQR